MPRVALLVVLTGLVWAVPATAHHGGAVEWADRVDGPLTGTATEFLFRFPHVLIYMDVADESGTQRRYAVNTRWTPTILRANGWSRDSVKPGDRVTITYEPHISDPYVVNMLTIEVNGNALPLDF